VSALVLTLPAVPHIPGRTPRPDDAVFAAAKAGLSTGLPPERLAASAAFLGGLEALNRRYYWEAHELFEAVWLCLPPASAERHLLRALIQTANAGLKARMGRRPAAGRICALARSALAEAFLHRDGPILGLTRADVVDQLERVDRETQANAK